MICHPGEVKKNNSEGILGKIFFSTAWIQNKVIFLLCSLPRFALSIFLSPNFFYLLSFSEILAVFKFSLQLCIQMITLHHCKKYSKTTFNAFFSSFNLCKNFGRSKLAKIPKLNHPLLTRICCDWSCCCGLVGCCACLVWRGSILCRSTRVHVVGRSSGHLYSLYLWSSNLALSSVGTGAVCRLCYYHCHRGNIVNIYVIFWGENEYICKGRNSIKNVSYPSKEGGSALKGTNLPTRNPKKDCLSSRVWLTRDLWL